MNRTKSLQAFPRGARGEEQDSVDQVHQQMPLPDDDPAMFMDLRRILDDFIRRYSPQPKS